jgi:hypothetical protein
MKRQALMWRQFALGALKCGGSRSCEWHDFLADLEEEEAALISCKVADWEFGSTSASESAPASPAPSAVSPPFDMKTDSEAEF